MATALATNLKLRVAQTKRLATTITKQQKKTALAQRMMNAECAVVLVFWRVHAIAMATSQNLRTIATATASPIRTVMAFAMSLNSPVAPMKELRTMKRLRHYDDGSCEYAGCTISSACNYDPSWDVLDADACDFDSCVGCTNPAACNYEEGNTIENGTCEFADAGYDCNGACLNDV